VDPNLLTMGFLFSTGMGVAGKMHEQVIFKNWDLIKCLGTTPNWSEIGNSPGNFDKVNVWCGILWLVGGVGNMLECSDKDVKNRLDL